MSSRRLASLLLIVLDALAVVVSFNLVAWGRGILAPGEWIAAALVLPVAIHFFGIYLIDGYSSRTDMLSITYASLHTIAQVGVLLFALLLIYAFIRDGSQLQSSRFVTSVSYLAVIPISLGYRRLIYLSLLRQREQRVFVFLGAREEYATFERECRANALNQPILFASREDLIAAPTAPGQPGHETTEIERTLQDTPERIEAIVLRETGRELPPPLAQRLMELHFKGVPTYTLELFHQRYWRKIPLYRLNQIWLFQEGFQIAREPVFERLKRASDVAFALIGLILFLPVLLLAAPLIWLHDRGPIFFHQTRVGRNRVPFEAYKLRTMREKHSGALYTEKGDARITPIGRFLRATRLDEAPQLWNVLRGDMSLIGPRAEWVKLVEDYEKQIPCYHFRHLVRPGITGWAQVNYPYGASVEDTLRKLEYDLYYIRFFSFVLDASIILKTIHVMLFGKGR